MKPITHKLRTVACSVAVLGSINFAFADVTSDAELLLNWAELKYPAIFTTHKTTKSQGPWLYRNYIEVGILAGVNKNDNKVYVQGGPWGNVAPTPLGPLTDLMAKVNANPNPNTSQICDVATLPAGLTVTQNGNVINVATNGCIVPPEDQNYCEFVLPPTPVATGLHVLTTGIVQKMEMKGVLSTVPGVLDAFLQTGLDFKTCIINAPSESTVNLTINTNICYDLTALLTPLASPPFITINPPVEQRIQSTATTTKVNDCFATDADSVTDLVTNEVWTKTNGAWTKLPTTP